MLMLPDSLYVLGVVGAAGALFFRLARQKAQSEHYTDEEVWRARHIIGSIDLKLVKMDPRRQHDEVQELLQWREAYEPIAGPTPAPPIKW